MVPDVFRGGYFLFGDKQTQKRKVQIRSSRQRPIKNLIRVSGCTPAELESRVNCLRIVCENNAKITKCPCLITLNEEEICGLPGDMRCRWVSFHSLFDTLFLLADVASHLIRTRQIQPVPRYIGAQMHRCPIVSNSVIEICAGQCQTSAEQFAIFSVRWFQANRFVEIR